jgi:hypothetical protein
LFSVLLSLYEAKRDIIIITQKTTKQEALSRSFIIISRGAFGRRRRRRRTLCVCVCAGLTEDIIIV